LENCEADTLANKFEEVLSAVLQKHREWSSNFELPNIEQLDGLMNYFKVIVQQVPMLDAFIHNIVITMYPELKGSKSKDDAVNAKIKSIIPDLKELKDAAEELASFKTFVRKSFGVNEKEVKHVKA
jgi:hypothetical protein